MNKPRIIIIGIDGINADLLYRLLPEEVFPTLHRIIGQGISGDLHSVFPTHSAAAWASFMTGQVPAMHGVFDFKVRFLDGSYGYAKPSSDTTLWHFLGKYGYSVGVFNFPVSFPPDAINGWMVSGMLSPDLRRFTYPSTLANEISSAFPGYILDVEWGLYENRPQDLLEDLSNMVSVRSKVALYLLEKHPVDVFAMAFIATDRAQHALWRYLDPLHPLHDARRNTESLRQAIYNFYRLIDKAIAEILSSVDKDTMVIVLSDHGFQSAAWQFHVNDWLASRHWLSYLPSKGKISRWARQLDTPRVRQIRRKIIPNISRHVHLFSPGGNINWSLTTAFCPWNFHQGIRINVTNRDPYGIVASGEEYNRTRESIKKALLDLRHNVSDKPVVSEVFFIEDIYEGRYLPAMPDLVFNLYPNFAPGIHRQTLFEPTGWASGDHCIHGFYAISSPAVSPGNASAANLIDIAPTVCNLLGIDRPSTMQGISITTMDVGIMPNNQSHPTHLDDNQSPTDENPQEYHLSKDEEVIERLRNLGYL
jgi:predicted AlkP superfamily phosphohydrolase/phosphomutase